MRTTLTIDEDILEAVKEIARREGRTAGAVLSDLARRELTRAPEVAASRKRSGFPLLPRGGALVTNAMVDRLRDEEGV